MLMKIGMAWQLINQRTSDRNSPLQSSLWFSIARFDRWPKHVCKRRHPHTIKGSPSLHHIGKSANEIISLFNNSLFNLAARRSRQPPRLVKQRYPHPRISPSPGEPTRARANCADSRCPGVNLDLLPKRYIFLSKRYVSMPNFMIPHGYVCPINSDMVRRLR